MQSFAVDGAKSPGRHGPARDFLEDATWSTKSELVPVAQLFEFCLNKCGIIAIDFTLVRLVHAFTCAGILPRQYLNFTEFANLGTVGKKYIHQGTYNNNALLVSLFTCNLAHALPTFNH